MSRLSFYMYIVLMRTETLITPILPDFAYGKNDLYLHFILISIFKDRVFTLFVWYTYWYASHFVLFSFILS